MHTHMIRRTTLQIDAALYRELKARAAREGRTLTDVLERTLRAGLDPARAPRRPALTLPSYDLGPFRIDPGDRDAWPPPGERRR